MTNNNLTTAQEFADTWSELFAILTDDYGCTLTCGEANAAAKFLRAFNHPGTATTLLAAHVDHHDEEDDDNLHV